MKLKRYLTEQFNINEIIQRDCQPFLKANKNSGPFYRHTWAHAREISDQKYMKMKVRKDRKPSDTPQHLHNLINDWFLKKFGWKARSEGIFTWNYDTFGSTTPLFFPIGPFKFLYSTKVSDLYLNLDTDIKKVLPSVGIAGLRSLGIEQLNTLFSEIFLKKLAPTYTDKNLPASHKFRNPRHEVIFQCKEYYLVDPLLYVELRPLIGEYK